MRTFFLNGVKMSQLVLNAITCRTFTRIRSQKYSRKIWQAIVKKFVKSTNNRFMLKITLKHDGQKVIKHKINLLDI